MIETLGIGIVIVITVMFAMLYVSMKNRTTSRSYRKR